MVQAIVIVFGSTLAAVGGLLAVVRFVPLHLRASDHDSKSAFLSMAGVSYAILLAFVVVAVWSDFTDAGQKSQDEVTRLSNLMRDAAPFPEATRVSMRRNILDYANSVVDREWGTMANGDADPVTARIYEGIWSKWYGYSPRGTTANAFYDQSLGRLNDVGVSRRERVIASRSSVPLAMWVLLVLGFVVTIAFTYQFRMEHLAMHVVSVSAVAVLTGFVLFLIFALQHPFAGDIAISPSPWQEFINSWANRPL